MYLFKVECSFTVKEYNPGIIPEPKFYRISVVSKGVLIEEQDKVGIWKSYNHVAQFTESLTSKGYYGIRVTDAIWEKVY